MFTETVMRKRAYSWLELLEMGFDTSLYFFSPLPEGTWLATLDAKQWGRRSNILCFFTAENGKKYKFSAFIARKGPGADHWYTAQDTAIDFSSPDIQPGQKFILITSTNSKGKPVWKSAAFYAP